MKTCKSRLLILSVCVLLLNSIANSVLAAEEPLLITLVKSGDLVVAEQWLSEPNIASSDGTTALHWAVRNSNMDAVQLLLDAGANTNAANRYGATPMFLAVTNGDLLIVNTLLEAGADVNQALVEGETLLMTAARTGNARIVAALLEQGADIEARESFYGETALIWAVSENHAETVTVLLDAGAQINVRSSRTQFARKAAGLSLLPQGDWTPLMYAARDGAFEAAEVLVERGADINLSDPDGTTALVLAIINFHYEMAVMLLESGADPNIADAAGMNALIAAVDVKSLPWTFGRPLREPFAELPARELIELILAKGANPNALLNARLMQRAHTTGDIAVAAGATAYLRAAKAGDVWTMNTLLEHGAKPNLRLENGNTALMLAAGLGWRDGNMAVPTKDPGTEEEAIAAIQICLDQGADINAVGANGDTALHHAVIGRGSIKIVNFLVEKGASLTAVNEAGDTPLSAIALTLGTRRDRSNVAVVLRDLMGLKEGQ